MNADIELSIRQIHLFKFLNSLIHYNLIVVFPYLVATMNQFEYLFYCFLFWQLLLWNLSSVRMTSVKALAKSLWDLMLPEKEIYHWLPGKRKYNAILSWYLMNRHSMLLALSALDAILKIFHITCSIRVSKYNTGIWRMGFKNNFDWTLWSHTVKSSVSYLRYYT